MTRTNAHAAGRRRTKPRRTIPVFMDAGRPIVSAATVDDARPELDPATDAFGRRVGFLCVDAGEGEGDERPTHAPLTAASLSAELDPIGIFRTTDGRLLAYCQLASLAGARIKADADVYMELNPAAPLGAVWDALFRPAFPEGEG